jgi:hypothetical protein
VSFRVIIGFIHQLIMGSILSRSSRTATETSTAFCSAASVAATAPGFLADRMTLREKVHESVIDSDYFDDPGEIQEKRTKTGSLDGWKKLKPGNKIRRKVSRFSGGWRS